MNGRPNDFEEDPMLYHMKVGRMVHLEGAKSSIDIAISVVNINHSHSTL